MKKIFALLIAGLALVGLAACGEDKAPAETEKVKINIWATAAEEAVVKAVVDEYNATHEKDFEYEFTAISEADAGVTLANDPTVNGAPALFLCADDHISTLQSKNIVAEIKNARREKIEANNSAVSVLGATLDGKVYGYPVTSDNGYFLWYNKSLLPEGKLGKLEDILAHANSTGKTFLMDVANGWYANSFIMSPEACGTESLYWGMNADGKSVYTTTWDSEAGVKVSQYIAGLLTPAYANETLVVGSNDAIVAGFENGTMLAAVSGTWMEKELIAAIGEENLGATKLPTYTVDGKEYQMASFTGSKVYCINKTRPVEEQVTAAELAELLTSKEAQLKRFEIRSSIPCNNEALLDARYTEHVTIGAKALGLQNAYACVQSKTADGRYWNVGQAIGQAYLDSNLGDYADWASFLKAQMDILRNPAV